MDSIKKDSPPLAVTIKQLTVNYGNTPVLWDVSFSIPQGHTVGIIGPNGAGKTTLLKTMLGLTSPVSGQVSFFDQPLKKTRERVAYVPQRESVDWDFPITVRDLVLMGRYGKLGLFRRPKEADYRAVQEYLQMVGMEAYSQRQISQLSGGQQQRVFLARALIQEADIYLMDEPFVGIDLASRKVIVDLLHRLRSQGKTIFVVHHELEQVESYFDWVVMLNVRLVGCGATEHVFTPEILNATYGKNYALFDEALKLSKEKQQGIQLNNDG